MDTYFSKFPLTSYNGMPVVDITRRAVISNTDLLNPFFYYPVTINNNERTDQISRKYYQDPYQEWVLFLTNQIYDPYDQWYMNNEEFQDYMYQKYTNIPLTTQTVMYYTNNWFLNTDRVSVAYFDALDPSLMKYYQPNLDGFGSVTSYSRIQEDWTINTNHLVSFNFSNTIPQFINNEIVAINYGANLVGSGQVAVCTNNVLNIQHVSGYYLPNGVVNAAAFSILGSQSNALITIPNANAVTILSFDTIPPEEDVFYSPVYVFDYETNMNESNKVLNILVSGYETQVSDALQKALNS